MSLGCGAFPSLVLTSDYGLQFLHQELEVLIFSIRELGNRLVITTLPRNFLLAFEAKSQKLLISILVISPIY